MSLTHFFLPPNPSEIAPEFLGRRGVNARPTVRMKLLCLGSSYMGTVSLHDLFAAAQETI